MKIVVASGNPVKVSAVREAFAERFGPRQLDVRGENVPSGVADQPRGDGETRRGAHNRAAGARERFPDADYWVGIEGGIDTVDGQLLAFAWMVIVHRSGRSGMARSVTLPLPPAVATLLSGGMELGEANDRVFGTHNSKQEGGAFGLLTDGRHTRGSVYSDTLAMALIPLCHALFAGDADSGTSGEYVQ